jgi:predicted DsbA family dithiol-disulfide isomerase
MHDRLFAVSPDLSSDNLASAATSIGLDATEFQKCITGEAADKVSSDMAEAARLGVRGTPSFFLGSVREDGSIDLAVKFVGDVGVDEIRTQLLALNSQS